MRTDTQQSPFVAKAHFLPDTKWLGKYETFWFQSRNLSKSNANELEQWQTLKRYVDRVIINKTHELIIFDNRIKSVNTARNQSNSPVSNIIFRSVNGEVLNNEYMKLSFAEWTFDTDFLNSLAKTFTKIGGPNELLPIGESEIIREKNYFDTWQNTINQYKQTWHLR